MKQCLNPYLPSYEYIPDSEPRVFGDRVYIYGSHDKFNAKIFCVNHYICYSASVDDLSDWRYEGVIFKKNQDPKNRLGLRLLFAPDVVQGADGKFYMYYAYDFMGIIGVAVCDTPAGKYKFLGHVKDKNGKIFGRRKGDQFPFDPGVLVDDDKKVYLYSGFAIKTPSIASGFRNLKNDGGVVLELESDMFTIKEEPKLLFPIKGEGSYPNHEFFEASSIRKVDGKYCFVYSSTHNHELCYAMSDYPNKGFEFKGTLVSIGDVFLDGNVDYSTYNHNESHNIHAKNYLGNTHGGMVEIKGQWYIFFHRQTNRHSYSRQAIAEPLKRDKDGNFLQSELTSSGLNNKPLIGKGTYEARIACNLYTKKGVLRYDIPKLRKHLKKHPSFTQEGKDRMTNPNQYIDNMMDGAIAGFKYFDFNDTKELSLKLRGKCNGKVRVYSDNKLTQEVANLNVVINSKKQWKDFNADLKIENGTKPLFFVYEGEGYVDFYSFNLK